MIWVCACGPCGSQRTMVSIFFSFHLVLRWGLSCLCHTLYLTGPGTSRVTFLSLYTISHRGARITGGCGCIQTPDKLRLSSLQSKNFYLLNISPVPTLRFFSHIYLFGVCECEGQRRESFVELVLYIHL